MKIKNRKEMAQYLDHRMTKSYTELLEDQKLEVDTSLVKTYLVEAHVARSNDEKYSPHHEIHKLLQDIVKTCHFVSAREGNINETEEECFFQIKFQTRHEKEVILFVDSADARFWLIHSMDNSAILDEILNKMIMTTHRLDRAWIPIQLLEEMTKYGSFRGLGLSYDRRAISDVDSESGTSGVEFMKMQLWGTNAKKVLEILRTQSAFPNETTLSKVKIKFWSDGQNSEKFTLDDIKYNGKITARGTSFESHITLTTDLYRKYSAEVKRIEEKYSIKHTLMKEGYSIEGLPINLLFPTGIKNIEKFLRHVFDCAFPFKLWGVPVKLAEDYYRVKAVDLHVGNSVDFEISREFIRVYLPSGACGNTIARLYTNFQHYYDAKVEISVGDDERLFRY
jgi:cation transport regulator ChaC